MDPLGRVWWVTVKVVRFARWAASVSVWEPCLSVMVCVRTLMFMSTNVHALDGLECRVKGLGFRDHVS